MKGFCTITRRSYTLEDDKIAVVIKSDDGKHNIDATLSLEEFTNALTSRLGICQLRIREKVDAGK